MVTKKRIEAVHDVNRCRVIINRVSTGTAITLTVQVNIDRVTEFAIKLFCFLLRERTPGDDCRCVS